MVEEAVLYKLVYGVAKLALLQDLISSGKPLI